MNPETNRFEPLLETTPAQANVDALRKALGEEELHAHCAGLVRMDGSPVPTHWSTFRVGELVVIKDYTFRVEYIGETSILFEPVRPEDVLKEAPNAEET